MKKEIIFLLGALVPALVPLKAQQSSPTPPPLPPPPLVHYPAGFAKWEVSTLYQPAAGSAPLQNTPRGAKNGIDARNEMDIITRTGDVIDKESAFGDGNRVSSWRVGQVEVDIPPDKKSLGFNSSAAAVNCFPGLDWVSAANYTGIQAVQGIKCFMFQDKVKITEQAYWQGVPYFGDPPIVDAVAAIDMATQLPISVTVGDETRAYRYFQPPAAPLVLPPEVASIVNKVSVALQSTPLPRPRP